MKREEGLLQNLFYVWQCVWRYNRVIVPVILANTLVTAAAPFTGLLLPRQILDELLTARRPGRLVLLLISFFLLSVLFSYLMLDSAEGRQTNTNKKGLPQSLKGYDSDMIPPK